MLSATSHQRVVGNPHWLLTLAGSISLMEGMKLPICQPKFFWDRKSMTHDWGLSQKETGVIYESKWDWTNLAMLKIFSALKKLQRKFPRDTQIFLPNSDTIHPSTLSFPRSPLEVAQSSSSLLVIIDSTIYSNIIEIIIYGIFISVIITANFLRCAQRGLLPRLFSRGDQSTGFQTTLSLQMFLFDNIFRDPGNRGRISTASSKELCFIL